MRGCGIFNSSRRRAEAAAILGKVDRFGIGADDFRAVALQFEREVQRSLSAELHDHALRLFPIEDGENVFECKRLEIETVGSVVIGRNGFRIAIDHDRLVAVLLERERGMAAAIIELDALPDAVRPAAQNHDLGAVHGLGLVLFLIRRIEIWRERFEFGGAGVHALEHGPYAEFVTAGAHRGGFHVPQLRDFLVAGARAL